MDVTAMRSYGEHIVIVVDVFKLRVKTDLLIGLFVLSVAILTEFEPTMRIGIIKRLMGTSTQLPMYRNSEALIKS